MNEKYVSLRQFYHPPQSIVVAPSSTTINNNYGYEYGGHVQYQGYYSQQQTTTAPLLPQYQSMSPSFIEGPFFIDFLSKCYYITELNIFCILPLHYFINLDMHKAIGTISIALVCCN